MKDRIAALEAEVAEWKKLASRHLAMALQLEARLLALAHFTLPDGSQVDLTDAEAVMELVRAAKL